MASVLTDSGDGYGCGDGYGYGYSYGDGYGDGYGCGDGYGYGYSYGDGYGDGDGYSFGDGYGYGYSDGCGDGYVCEDFINLGDISGYSVYLSRPFNVVKVGCQIMSLIEWEKEWEKVCREYEVMVSKHQVDDLIKKAICFTE